MNTNIISFSKYKEEDYSILYMSELAKGPIPLAMIAKAIIDASQKGVRPVNLRFDSKELFMSNWLRYDNGRKMNNLIKGSGYKVLMSKNLTEDGIQFLLEKRK